MRILLLLLCCISFSHAQDANKWEQDLEKIYNGTIVYTPEQLSKMFDTMNKDDVVIRSLWGMLVVQTTFVNSEDDAPDLPQKLSEVFQMNKKISDFESSSKELFYAGRFSFYLLGYSTFYKVPKASFYEAFMEFRSLLLAVITKNQGYIVEANVILADGYSRPATIHTNTWNSFVLKHTADSVISPLSKSLQYRALLSRARILVKQNSIIQAKEVISQARALMPEGGAELSILESSII